MNTRPFLLLLPLAAALLCRAEDFTLADGTVLHEARVVRKDGESATIAHTTGVQRISYDRLSPELQVRLELTPEAVKARREAARLEEKRRSEARERKAAQQRAALETSGLSPRYMTGADIISLHSSWTTLSAAAAEYLAAEWNRREALRCGLTVEAQRYKEDAAELARNIEKERAEMVQAQERIAGLEAQLRETQAELRQTRLTLKKLEKQNQELSSERKTNTTVTIYEPHYVPVYRPQPIILPPAVRPPAPMRPQPPRQPVPVRIMR